MNELCYVLKPCPFCGSKEVSFVSKPFHEYYQQPVSIRVICKDCWGSSGKEYSKKEAAVKWNNRHIEE